MLQPQVYGRYVTADGEEVYGWYTRAPYPGQENPHPSNTVPDQSMTPREILDRYASGRLVGGDSSEPQFFNENTVDWDAYRHMDLADQEDLLKARRDELHKLSALYEAALAAKKEEAANERRMSDKKADDVPPPKPPSNQKSMELNDSRPNNT